MINQITPLRIVLPVALCLGLAGCLSKPALVRQTYALQATAVMHPAESAQGMLSIKPCEVSPLFASRSFIYRIGPDAYEADPYAGFLVSPDQALEIPIRSYLRSSGLFAGVTDPGSAVRSDSVLEIHVSELYGDLRQTGQAASVLSMRLILLDAGTNNPPKVVFSKDYSRRSPIDQNTAAAVAAGWNRSLGDIMAEAVSDISAARRQAASAAMP